jgi:hypothetical protein
MKETMKSILRPDTSDHAVVTKPELFVIQESVVVPSISARPSQSQDLTLISMLSDDDGDDDYFEDGDMFSRLEEIRARLELELGLDKFREAYKTVQNLQDGDDDAMEEGIKLVTRILGHDKVHLYPSILQLVMADGAYAEGND